MRNVFEVMNMHFVTKGGFHRLYTYLPLHYVHSTEKKVTSYARCRKSDLGRCKCVAHDGKTDDYLQDTLSCCTYARAAGNCLSPRMR